jgi:hypothetical protein
MASIGPTIRNSEAIQAAISVVVFPMTLTNSVFLPTQTMPGRLRAFAEHQPITIVADALRGLTLGQGALPTGNTVIGETPARPRLDRRHTPAVRPSGDPRLWTDPIARSSVPAVGLAMPCGSEFGLAFLGQRVLVSAAEVVRSGRGVRR